LLINPFSVTLNLSGYALGVKFFHPKRPESYLPLWVASNAEEAVECARGFFTTVGGQ